MDTTSNLPLEYASYFREKSKVPSFLYEPRTWVVFLSVIASLLLALKTGQRMLVSGMDFDPAFEDAFFTRLRNNSTFHMMSHCITAVAFAFFWLPKVKHDDSLREVTAGRAGGFLALMSIFWWMYLRKVAGAPDPGTFFSNYTGLPKAIQNVEGVVNLMCWTVAAFVATTVTAVTRSLVVSSAADRRTATGLMTAALVPLLLFLGFSKTAGFGWLISQWSIGNVNATVFGFTIMGLSVYLAIFFFIWWRFADRISPFDFVQMLRKLALKKKSPNGDEDPDDSDSVSA